jgi:hypothetical protein
MRRGIAIACLFLLVGAGLVLAGALEPPGPPAPTMKSLNDIAPTWSLSLDSTDGEPDGCNSSRFKCVMGSVAVLDMETGLVWERVPNNPWGPPWLESMDACQQKMLGNRGGWRLPRAEELFSLIDTSSGTPRLPESHPFTGRVDATCYYSTNTVATDGTKAWGLSSDVAQGSYSTCQVPKSGGGTYRCVRGGNGDVAP